MEIIYCFLAPEERHFGRNVITKQDSKPRRGDILICNVAPPELISGKPVIFYQNIASLRLYSFKFINSRYPETYEGRLRIFNENQA